MKAPFGSVLIAWMLSFCLTLSAVAQSAPQAPSATPPPTSTASDTQQTATPANPDNNQVVPPAATAGSTTGEPDTDSTTGATPAGVKTGSKSDVDAIGNRNVGGRGLGDWYSTETEIKMGKQYAMMFEKPSLRTRLTFEAGINSLGGHALFMECPGGIESREGKGSRFTVLLPRS